MEQRGQRDVRDRSLHEWSRASNCPDRAHLRTARDFCWTMELGLTGTISHIILQFFLGENNASKKIFSENNLGYKFSLLEFIFFLAKIDLLQEKSLLVTRDKMSIFFQNFKSMVRLNSTKTELNYRQCSSVTRL